MSIDITSPGVESSQAGAANAPLRSEVATRAAFDRVRYAQSWEDPESLCGALAPNADSRIVSIAAAGDNSFALLLQGAGHVTSIDMSAAQCALVELKRAAVLTLNHSELLRFVGVTAGTDRAGLYMRVRRELPDEARAYWDTHPTLIANGIIHIGKLEDMFRIFRSRVLPLLHGKRTRRAAFDHRTRAAREVFWHDRWNNVRWRNGIRVFFSQAVIGRLGRDPSFFEHVRINVAEHYARRAFHAFVELDPSTNFFLQYIMLGEYLDLETGPPWLAPGNHQLLRERLHRLDVRCVELESFLAEHEDGAFTGFNLSDVFEWMSDSLHERVYGELVRVAAPGATLAYWNNLVPRSVPTAFADRVTTDRALAQRLHDADRSFLYRDFHVDRVLSREPLGDPS